MTQINKREANLSFSISLIFALIFILLFILPLVACPLWGQVVQKKQLNAADYHLLGELNFEKISDNGKWATYHMIYQNSIDTLFVDNTTEKKRHFFSSGSNGLFLGDRNFICMTPEGLQFLNLDTFEQKTIALSAQYVYLPLLGRLILLNSQNELVIMDKQGKILHTIKDVTYYSASPCGKKLLYITKDDQYSSVGILELEKSNKNQWIIEKIMSDFTMVTWEKKGRALAFIASDIRKYSQQSLLYYILDSNILYQMHPAGQTGFPSDKEIDTTAGYAITISEDLKKVFFSICPADNNLKNKSDISASVELWNANAKWIYPMEQIMGKYGARAQLAVWYPVLNKFGVISSAELPKVMLAGKEKYALLSNPQAYEPQFDYDGPRDYFLMDLNTGKKELFLKKQNAAPVEGIPICSPDGKYLTYYKENDWWTYNISSKTHINLTKKIGIPFIGKVFNLYISSPFGNPGWTSNDNEIILYDQYDIWLLKPDGTQFRRITQGREKHIQFRISNFATRENLVENYSSWTSRNINLADVVILQAKGDDGKTGYFKWESKTGEIPLVYKNSRITKLQVINDHKSYIYQEEQFDLPPRLLIKKDKKVTAFFQSNPQQKKYFWGSSELISYSNSKGQKLNGILYYPAYYDPEKKYPMIVHIYERQSQNLYKYINPTLENSDGYNPAALTNEGYFVLCPDIIHEPENEGLSAVDCTASAVKEIISRELVIPDKIGLMGHSFGGYQAAFIITQTNLFAAAVAGNAITDLNSYYLSVNWNSGRTAMNYFQTESFKIEKSPYEIPEVFTRNSPIIFADKITTPLLSFTGKQDHHVDWYQSVELYLALRRLNKKHIMLIYPQEAHSVVDPASQRDLTTRIYQWFAYYLKDEKPASWITDGVQ